jgi:uncharacterized protein
MASVALVDAGPLVGAIDRRDRRHALSASFFDGFTGRLLTTWPVVTETCHMVSARSAVTFMRSIARGGIEVRDIPREALPGIADLMERYADLPMDLADASLVWLADEMGIRDIVTFDERDFAVYRLSDGKRFNNLMATRRR